MAQDFHGLIAEQRLESIDGILFAAGWQRNADGHWAPPEKYREAIAERHSGENRYPVFHRSVAIRFQVQADEFFASGKATAEFKAAA